MNVVDTEKVAIANENEDVTKSTRNVAKSSKHTTVKEAKSAAKETMVGSKRDDCVSFVDVADFFDDRCIVDRYLPSSLTTGTSCKYEDDENDVDCDDAGGNGSGGGGIGTSETDNDTNNRDNNVEDEFVKNVKRVRDRVSQLLIRTAARSARKLSKREKTRARNDVDSFFLRCVTAGNEPPLPTPIPIPPTPTLTTTTTTTTTTITPIITNRMDEEEVEDESMNVTATTKTVATAKTTPITTITTTTTKKSPPQTLTIATANTDGGRIDVEFLRHSWCSFVESKKHESHWRLFRSRDELSRKDFLLLATLRDHVKWYMNERRRSAPTTNTMTNGEESRWFDRPTFRQKQFRQALTSLEATKRTTYDLLNDRYGCNKRDNDWCLIRDSLLVIRERILQAEMQRDRRKARIAMDEEFETDTTIVETTTRKNNNSDSNNNSSKESYIRFKRIVDADYACSTYRSTIIHETLKRYMVRRYVIKGGRAITSEQQQTETETSFSTTTTTRMEKDPNDNDSIVRERRSIEQILCYALNRAMCRGKDEWIPYFTPSANNNSSSTIATTTTTTTTTTATAAGTATRTSTIDSLPILEDNEETYMERCDAFWKQVFRHCATLFPTGFIAQIFHYCTRHDISEWKVNVMDVIDYVDWLCENDEMYLTYTQQIVNRYRAMTESSLISICQALYDQECVLFSLYVLNLHSLQTRNDLLKRHWQMYNDPYGPPFNYDTFVRAFYDCRVYEDTLEAGVDFLVQYLSYFVRNYTANTVARRNVRADTDGTLIASSIEPFPSNNETTTSIARNRNARLQQLEQQHQQHQREAECGFIVDTCAREMQTVFDFLNATLWFFDGQQIHLFNGFWNSRCDTKEFTRRIKGKNHRLKHVRESLATPTFNIHTFNVEQMQSSTWRYRRTQQRTNTGGSSKMSKVLGNTNSLYEHSNVNTCFLRVRHGSKNYMIQNVHTNTYELVLPSLLYVMQMDHTNLEIEEKDLFPSNHDERVTEYCVTVLQQMHSFFRIVESVDSFGMLLYSNLVENKLTEKPFNVVDPLYRKPTAIQTTSTIHASQTDSTISTVPTTSNNTLSSDQDWSNFLNDTTNDRSGMECVRGDNGKLPNSTPTTGKSTTTPSSSLSTPTMSSSTSSSPSQTIDKNDFFRLMVNVNVEWIHEIVSSKPFNLFRVTCLMVLQLVREYGLRKVINGLGTTKLTNDLTSEKRFRLLTKQRHNNTNVNNHYDEEDDEFFDRNRKRRKPNSDNRLNNMLSKMFRASMREQERNLSTTDRETFAQGLRMLRYNGKGTNQEKCTAKKPMMTITQPSTNIPPTNLWTDSYDESCRLNEFQRNRRRHYNQQQHATTTNDPVHRNFMLERTVDDLVNTMLHDNTFYRWSMEASHRVTETSVSFPDEFLRCCFGTYLYVVRIMDTFASTSTTPSSSSSIGTNETTTTTTTTTTTITTAKHLLTVYRKFARDSSKEIRALRRAWPCKQVSCKNLLQAAIGLERYIDLTMVNPKQQQQQPERQPQHQQVQQFETKTRKKKRKELDNTRIPFVYGKLHPRKRTDICYFLVCLYTFADCDLALLMFLLRVFTSVKFPGPWSKTLFFIQGVSNSGKSELIENLRTFFNSTRGVIDPSVWRSTSANEIGTNVFPIMENLVCQSDEVETMNSSLTKTIVSKTSKQCRSFCSQVSQQLHSMAKIFVTVNRMPRIVSDDGVLTRMNVMIPTFHQYQPLVRNVTTLPSSSMSLSSSSTMEEAKSATANQSTVNIAQQFMTRRYPAGIHESFFLCGMYHVLTHFATNLCTRSTTSFLTADTYSYCRRDDKLNNNNNNNNNNDNNDRRKREHELSTSKLDMMLETTNLLKRASEIERYVVNGFREKRESIWLEGRLLTRDISELNGDATTTMEEKIFVNLQDQPRVALDFKTDTHANIDPMVKFDLSYQIIHHAVPIHWRSIERCLRLHLINFHLEEEGLSLTMYSSITSASSSSSSSPSSLLITDNQKVNYTDPSSLLEESNYGVTNDDDNDDTVAMETMLAAASSPIHANALRRMDLRAFCDRFKVRFASYRFRDSMTNQIVPDKWCLRLKRIT